MSKCSISFHITIYFYKTYRNILKKWCLHTSSKNFKITREAKHFFAWPYNTILKISFWITVLSGQQITSNLKFSNIFVLHAVDIYFILEFALYLGCYCYYKYFYTKSSWMFFYWCLSLRQQGTYILSIYIMLFLFIFVIVGVQCIDCLI